MKEKIDRLAGGHTDQNKIRISCADARLEGTVPALERTRFETTVSAGGERLKGLIYSTDPHVKPANTGFVGTECKIAFDVAPGSSSGDITGCLQLVSNAGELSIPYCFKVSPAGDSSQFPGTLKDLTDAARADACQAAALFVMPGFDQCAFMGEPGIAALYEGLKGQPSRERALEEFLIGTGQKERVTAELVEDGCLFTRESNTLSGEIVLMRSGWGHLDLTLEEDGGIIELETDSIYSRDFDGDECHIRYAVRPDRLHAGRNFTRVRIYGISTELSYDITVMTGSRRNEKEAAAKREFLNYVRQYIKLETGKYESAMLLNSMQVSLESVAGTYGVMGKLWLADVYMRQKKVLRAGALLDEVKDNVLDGRQRSVSAYLFYTYLRTQLMGDTQRMEDFVKICRHYYEDGKASDMALFILMKADDELKANRSLALLRLKEHFRAGSRSPYLYTTACRLLSEEPGLLRALDDFEIQSMRNGLKYGLVTEELAAAAARLSIGARHIRPLCVDLMQKLYNVYERSDILTAVCAMLIRMNSRGKKAFKWYSLGVEADISLTRLYDYYIYSLPDDCTGALPRSILLYFSYNSSLDYNAQAILYTNVLRYLKKDDDLYAAYESQISSFAIEQLFQSHMSRELAQIYARFIFPEMVDERIARILPKLLYAMEIRCEDRNMQQAVVCYDELRGEVRAQLRDGAAYIPVYTQSSRIVFQDGFGNRYAGIRFEKSRMMESKALCERVAELNPAHKMLSLIKVREILRRRAYTAQDMAELRGFAQEEDLSPAFSAKLSAIMISYFSRQTSAAADEYMLSAAKRRLGPADALTVMGYLTDNGYHKEAFGLVRQYGYDGLGTSRLFALTSRTILARLFAEDAMLTDMAYTCFCNGMYDAVTEEYLCRYFNGSCADMYKVLQAASGLRVQVYDLPERLLGQMLFSDSYEHMDEVFVIYASNGSMDQSLVYAYFVVVCKGYFEDGSPFEDEQAGLLEEVARSGGVRSLPVYCMLALTKYYSTCDELGALQLGLCSEMLEQLCRRGIYFDHYSKLARFVSLPGDIAGKTVIGYRSAGAGSVSLRIRILPDETKWRSEQMTPVFGDHYARLVTLLYGETVEYEICEGQDAAPVLTGSAGYDAAAPQCGREESLNGLLKAWSTQDEGLKDSLEEYIQKDEMTKRLFGIL